MSLSISPNRYAPWYQVLESLGFEVDVTALPAKTVCPLCRSVALRVYEDNKFGGAWHHCERCKKAGDMITLAANFWKTSHGNALQRLSQDLPIPPELLTADAITSYINDHIARPRRVQAFLDSLEDNLNQESPPGMDLIKRFNLDAGLFSTTWSKRMGRYLGIATVEQVRQMIDRRSQPPGRKMKAALAIPFHNLPGRLSGFLLVWREGDNYKSFYCPVQTATTVVADGSSRYLDPGLVMYDTLQVNGYADTFGRRAFVLPYMEALRMQSKHMLDSNLPLPVVGVHNGVHELTQKRFRRCQTYEVWNPLSHRHFVFWAPKITADLFNMAARCDGAVAMLDEDRLHELSIMKHRLFKLQKIALPWQVALDKYLSQASVQHRVRLLQELDLPALAYDEFRRNCSDATRGILSAGGTTTTQRWVAFGSKRVIATNSGWFLEPGQHLISSAKLVIEKTLLKQETGELHYQGKIQNRNDEVKFVEKATIVDNKTFEWMQRTLVASGAVPMQYDAKWSKHAVSLAMQFHTPVSIKNAGRYGWSSERSAFVMPRFIIRVGGKVEPESDAIDDPLCPGMTLPNPAITSVRLEPLLAPTVESELFWAVLACVAANLVSPALNTEPAGIGLVGLGAAWAGRATARTVGCATHTIDARHPTSITSKLTRAVNTHNWPLLLDFPRRSARSYLAAWLNDADVKNVVMEVDRNLFTALKVYPHWRFVHCDTPITDVDRIVSYGAGILPGWLADFCRRQLKFDSNEPAMARQVLFDMATWATNLGNDSRTITNAAKWLEDTDDSTTDVARHFTQTLCRLVDDGVIPATKAGFEDPKTPGCSYHESDDPLPRGLFVPRAVVNKALLSEGLPLLEPTTVTAALAEAGALEQETNYLGYQGWLINTDWWQKQFKLYRKTKSRILRVVG